jgi:hypothetical protein
MTPFLILAAQLALAPAVLELVEQLERSIS